MGDMIKGEPEEKLEEKDETVDFETRTKFTDFQIAKKLVQLKQSADSRGIEFDLSFKKVKSLMSTKKCYYTGVAFGKGNLARSFDRVESDKGYVDSNVVVCTVDINIKKANLSVAEIHLLSKKLTLHAKKK